MASESYVTLATNDNYALGALVLAASLRAVQTTKKISILITEGVSKNIRKVLTKFFDLIEMVDILASPDKKILQALKRPELSVTLTKIHCWKLKQFNKCVFMDADTMVTKNCDELFQRDELSAVPDIGWPDCFNSGVFVYQPSQKTFNEMIIMANNEGSFDGGDQGLLNSYFNDWSTTNIDRHLSFIYNMTLTSAYSYLPAYKRFGQNVKIIHFLGTLKPWHCSYNNQTGKLNTFVGNDYAQNLMEKWWQIFNQHVYPSIDKMNIVGIESSTTNNHNMSIQSGQQSTSSSNNNDNNNDNGGNDDNRSNDRYQAWQDGQIDYLGQDSFDNIQKCLDAAIKKP